MNPMKIHYLRSRVVVEVNSKYYVSPLEIGSGQATNEKEVGREIIGILRDNMYPENLGWEEVVKTPKTVYPDVHGITILDMNKINGNGL